MMGSGMGGLDIGWMLLFWAVLVALAIWLVGILFPSAKTPHKNDSDASPSAAEILRERYAKGELTTEQYRDMLKTIEQQ